MEYSLSARLFTLVGFDELVETLLSTQINKRSFGKNTVYQYFFSLGGGVAGGCVSTSEVINYGGSCGKVSLDSY